MSGFIFINILYIKYLHFKIRFAPILICGQSGLHFYNILLFSTLIKSLPLIELDCPKKVYHKTW